MEHLKILRSMFCDLSVAKNHLMTTVRAYFVFSDCYIVSYWTGLDMDVFLACELT